MIPKVVSHPFVHMYKHMYKHMNINTHTEAQKCTWTKWHETKGRESLYLNFELGIQAANSFVFFFPRRLSVGTRVPVAILSVFPFCLSFSDPGIQDTPPTVLSFLRAWD